MTTTGSTAAAERLVLSVDCGSTLLKGALFDSNLVRHAQVDEAVVYTASDGDVVEFDAGRVEILFERMLARLERDCGVQGTAIRQVAFASQAQTFCLCDGQGQATTPFLSWLDTRARDICGMVQEELGTEFDRHCSFATLLPQLQVAKVAWLRQHRPWLFSDSTRLCSLPGYLAWRLGAGNCTDRNLAAMGGMYSLRLGTWWPAALASCRLTTEQMPALVDVGCAVPAVGWTGGRPWAPDLEVVFAGNDQTAGAYGNGCDADTVVVTLGTALVAYRRAGPHPGPYHPGTCWGPYPGGSQYELATQDEGCLALDWARSVLAGTPEAPVVDGWAEQVMARRRVANAPLFFPHRRGQADAWSKPGKPEEMGYAVLEGICFSVRRLLDALLPGPAHRGEVCVIGGGSRSTTWLGLLADVLERPVRRGSGDALLGAAAMAVGRSGPRGEGAAGHWHPNPERVETLESRYRHWQEAR